ncbi:hypothetical protein, partial [Enterococcus casseliflavus]|uniref:hypothetical protein n=1 Tax=Enterococcus casseliflavus TaxID=37734 RepID=UPI003D136EF6
LFRAGLYDGAYYLAGYAIECALKAAISRLTREHDFPDRKRVLDSYSHNLVDLLAVTDFEAEFRSQLLLSPNLKTNWDMVRIWSEQSRYARWT